MSYLLNGVCASPNQIPETKYCTIPLRRRAQMHFLTVFFLLFKARHSRWRGKKKYKYISIWNLYESFFSLCFISIKFVCKNKHELTGSVHVLSCDDVIILVDSMGERCFMNEKSNLANSSADHYLSITYISRLNNNKWDLRRASLKKTGKGCITAFFLTWTQTKPENVFNCFYKVQL